MKIKITFVFILFLLLRLDFSGQIKEVKHNQLPVYVEKDTIIIYDAWIQTAKEEAKQLDKIDKLEKKLDNVSKLLHSKRELSIKALEALNTLDSLKKVNDSLRSRLDSASNGINKDLRAKVSALNSRNKVLQSQVSNLRKTKRRLRRYCIMSSTGFVAVILIVVLI